MRIAKQFLEGKTLVLPFCVVVRSFVIDVYYNVEKYCKVLAIMTKRAVWQTASVYRKFIKSSNLSKKQCYFRQYGEKVFLSRQCSATVLQSVQSIYKHKDSRC